jgi:hypothetical protein
MGLQRASFDVIERLERAHGSLQPSGILLGDISHLMQASGRAIMAMQPVGYLLAGNYRHRSADRLTLVTSHDMLSICQSDPHNIIVVSDHSRGLLFCLDQVSGVVGA